MFDLKFKQIKKAFRSWKVLPAWLQHSPTFGKQIISIRNSLGMNQEQLAKRIGSGQRAIVKLEKEEVDPRLSTLSKVAEGLNCKLLVRIVPNEDIELYLRRRAREKASQLVKMSVATSNIELQKPSDKTVEEEIKRMMEEILQKKRAALWEDPYETLNSRRGNSPR